MADVVEEDFKVSVEQKDEGVYDIPLVLNTMTSGTAEAVTAPINGVLKAVILSASMPVDIVISFAELPEIELLRERYYSGTRYIPLRISPVSKTAQAFNYSPQEWFLNNSLRVSIKGGMMAELSIILRCVHG